MLNNISLNISQKVILLTATVDLTDENVESLKQLLKSKPDWQYIKYFSEGQGTAGFLYKIIKKHNLIDLIPEELYNHLQSIYFQTHTNNILALVQLKKVLACFKKEEIKTVLLKGIASAEFIYKDLGLRPMGDIDILVEPKRILDAEKILFDLGYVNNKPYKSKKVRAINIRKHLYAFVNTNIIIELHKELISILQIYRIPNDEIWRNLNMVNIENETAYIICTDKNIEYLSLHSILHFFRKEGRLNIFVDLSELIKNEENNINWAQIVKNCKDYKISLPAYSALYLCKKYLNAPVPDDVLEKLKVKGENLDKLFLLLLDNQPEKIYFRTQINYFKTILKIDGFKNKIMYMWTVAFPSKEYMIYNYKIKNKKFFFLYYFIRFFIKRH